MKNTQYFFLHEEQGSPYLFISCKYRETPEELSGPAFAYWKTSQSFPTHRLYLRDPFRSHYHHGIPDIAENLNDLTDHIMWYIWNRDVRKVVLLGASQGGYLALLLGKLIELRDTRLHIRCYSYDPQTHLRYRQQGETEPGRGEQPEFRWGYIRGPSPTPEYLDLKALFAQNPSPKGRHRFYVHHGTEEEDIRYADNLREATRWPAYENLSWRRRLIIRQVRRRESVHGSEIVRQNQTGKLQALLLREFPTPVAA